MEARILLISGNERFQLEAEYNAEFLFLLKRRVPTRYRAWNPSLHRWEISRSYLEEVKKLAKEYFEYVNESLI